MGFRMVRLSKGPTFSVIVVIKPLDLTTIHVYKPINNWKPTVSRVSERRSFPHLTSATLIIGK